MNSSSSFFAFAFAFAALLTRHNHLHTSTLTYTNMIRVANTSVCNSRKIQREEKLTPVYNLLLLCVVCKIFDIKKWHVTRMYFCALWKKTMIVNLHVTRHRGILMTTAPQCSTIHILNVPYAYVSCGRREHTLFNILKVL